MSKYNIGDTVRVGLYEEKAQQIMSWDNNIPFEENQDQIEQLLCECLRQA